MAIKIPIGHKIFQSFPFQDFQKYIKIWIFGTQTCHLATLVEKFAK
jgi:hypothetical protein